MLNLIIKFKYRLECDLIWSSCNLLTHDMGKKMVDKEELQKDPEKFHDLDILLLSVWLSRASCGRKRSVNIIVGHLRQRTSKRMQILFGLDITHLHTCNCLIGICVKKSLLFGIDHHILHRRFIEPMLIVVANPLKL